MPSVRRYRDADADLDDLYGAIVEELVTARDLRICSRSKGEVDGKPFRSVTAARKSIFRALVGGLREVSVTIAGKPNDFVVEIYTGAWFSNLTIPGAEGLLIAGPFGGLGLAGALAIIYLEYRRRLSNRIGRLVKERSREGLAANKPESRTLERSQA